MSENSTEFAALLRIARAVEEFESNRNNKRRRIPANFPRMKHRAAGRLNGADPALGPRRSTHPERTGTP